MTRIHHPILFLSTLVLLLAGCAAPKEIGPTPYQVLLDGYYQSLNTGNYETIVARANRYLDGQGSDDAAARMIRTQIYLQAYRQTDSSLYLKNLLNDLKVLDLQLDNPARNDTLEDWLRPRKLITMGDALLYANQVMTLSPEKDKTGAGYLAAKAAEQYFYKAWRLATAVDNPSPGMQREAQHALDGLLQTQFALANTIALYDFGGQKKHWQERNQQAKRHIQLLLEEDAVSLQPQYGIPAELQSKLHQSISDALASIARDSRNQLITTPCTTITTDEDKEKRAQAWKENLILYEKAALHDYLAFFLAGQPQVSTSDPGIENIMALQTLLGRNDDPPCE